MIQHLAKHYTFLARTLAAHQYYERTKIEQSYRIQVRSQPDNGGGGRFPQILDVFRVWKLEFQVAV